MKQLISRLLRRLTGRDPLQRLLQRGLIVGQRFYMQDNCTIDAWHCCHIRIGDDVTLGPNVTLLAHDASTKQALGMVRLGKVSIGSRVFIGAGSIILPGVTIGNDVIIGAGSIVTRDIPDGSLAVGNPAQVIETTEAYIERQRLRMTEVPCFGEAFTAHGGVTPAMRADMNTRMRDGEGFIV